MSEKKYTLSGVCPYCPAVLDYAEDARAVECHCCGNTVPTSLLRPLNFEERDNSLNENEKRIADGVSSSGTGVIYFDNFCDNYDWSEFASNANLSIYTLDVIREACKLKFPADPITYFLDFRCVAIPFSKKIECLAVLEKKIISNYSEDDISDLYEYVDLYSAITTAVAEKRDYILDMLKKDIKLAKRFGAEAHVLADMEYSLKIFEANAKKVQAASSIEQIPGYKKAKEMRDVKIAEKIRRRGIDAEKTYEKAIELLNDGNVDNALHLFAAINGYKASSNYIDEHSTIFKFNDELWCMAGRLYLSKNNGPYQFAVSDPLASAKNTLSLYEIEQSEISAAPAISLMSDIIYNFGNKIFFIQSGVSLCCYDASDENVVTNLEVLDEAPSGDYATDHKTPIYYSSDKTKFIIRKKLRENEEKPGCFLKRKKKKAAPTINRANNYSIILVDMDDVTSKVIIPEAVDIMDFYDDKIFYSTVTVDEAYPSFRVYDISNDTDMEILNDQCVIHNVSHGHIIYSIPSPNIYNMDLYSVNIGTNEHKHIDSNIRSYYTTYGGRVFYTVGSDDSCRLMRAEIDGSGRREIMENPGRICTLSSGWLYYINGSGENSCLMKVKIDGSQTVLVASRFASLAKMTNSYVYYFSTRGDLRFVRNDGNGDTLIAKDVAGTHVIIDDKNVYYLKRDYISPEAENDGYGYSIYSTDLFGKNLRKLSHAVDSMAERDGRYIYIRKKVPVTYAVTVPVDKRTVRNDIITKELIKYEAYDRVSGEFTEIVTLGKPSAPSNTYKKGCLFFSKWVTVEGSISEVKPVYRRDGVSAVGKIRDEEEAELRRAEEEKRAAKEEKRAAREARREERKARREEEAELGAEENELDDLSLGDDSDAGYDYEADDQYSDGNV